MYKTISMAALAALTILSVGCFGSGDTSASNAADTLTRRQKNEIISTLPVPGARPSPRFSGGSAEGRVRLFDG
jgi:hypothetical protein